MVGGFAKPKTLIWNPYDHQGEKIFRVCLNFIEIFLYIAPKGLNAFGIYFLPIFCSYGAFASLKKLRRSKILVEKWGILGVLSPIGAA
jgi:hypothetical protein